jgi:hypothetical protein
MKNAFKVSILAVAALALSAGAFAQNASTNIQIQANVSAFDNINCLTNFVDLGGGMSITNSGQTGTQPVECNVTSNDSYPVNITAYLPTTAPLTGINPSNRISNYFIWGGQSGSMAPFQPLSGGLTGNDGLIVASDIPHGSNVPVFFLLSLNIPTNTVADMYSATLTIAITPAI